MQKKLIPPIKLFLFFVKIGCFTFGGGWSILAQMEQEFVDKQKLITKEELLDITSVGRSMPGIMITNDIEVKTINRFVPSPIVP